MVDEGYNVVFEYTKETGGYEGVITWSSFKNQEDFKKMYSSDVEKRQRVIAEGVTPERAIELCNKTPTKSDIASCFEEATLPNGEINKDILEMKLRTILFARSIKKD